MHSCRELAAALQSGEFDNRLRKIYAPNGIPAELEHARQRALAVTEQTERLFRPAGDMPAALFSGPGRTEIGGNHTDHQHGHVLCGSVDLDILACAVKNELGVIRAVSEGYDPVEVDISSLEPREEEKGTSAALIRGVAAGIAARGHTLSGVDICMVSDVLSGSGLSSSAAYEILIGNVLNHFCCTGAIDPVELAKIGQFAENTYFGKPCGLMDQMASSVGGAVAIDFRDPASPAVTRIDTESGIFSGYTLCIVDTRSGHADLTEDYADITREMKAIAGYFGKEVLREVPEGDVIAAMPELRRACGDRAVLRALHYYGDDRRAAEEAEALQRNDFERFLTFVRESGLSSALYLQNIWSPRDPKSQAVSVALAEAERLLQGRGAVRVHGGGFGGTIQAFVPDTLRDTFRRGMDTLLGEGSCHMLRIRPEGGCLVAE